MQLKKAASTGLRCGGGGTAASVVPEVGRACEIPDFVGLPTDFFVVMARSLI